MIDISGPISFWKAFTFWQVAPKTISRERWFRHHEEEINGGRHVRTQRAPILALGNSS